MSFAATHLQPSPCSLAASEVAWARPSHLTVLPSLRLAGQVPLWTQQWCPEICPVVVVPQLSVGWPAGLRPSRKAFPPYAVVCLVFVHLPPCQPIL